MSVRALKALTACQRYHIIDRRIKEVTRALGDTFCTAPQEGGVFSDTSIFEEPIRFYKHCIDRYYYGPKIPFEEMCEGCKYKHNLIQYRKELRQKLGAAKRWINAIGKEEDNNVR